tara:strand:+ start:201 stop:4079 length:3879 start_codon:yes stop_codon:yes gene_type:complete
MKLIFSSIKLAAVCILTSFAASNAYSQVSVAREWNEILLEAIRNDYARPTVHARNLYHHSIIAYDSWAVYFPSKDTYLIGDTLNGYISNFDGINIPLEINESIEETISYASFYFINQRYEDSPDFNTTYLLMYNYMIDHGYSVNNSNIDYENGGAAELGNYIAQQMLNFGNSDGSNEFLEFENTFYSSINPPLIMSEPGNPDIIDPNRWQTLTLDSTIDQSGNLVENTLPFLSPEWGNVKPFALKPGMATQHFRDGDVYKVYFDTVQPAYLDTNSASDWNSFYKWNHSLVSIWQSHLDTADGVLWDISPASMGNNLWYPSNNTLAEYSAFYNLEQGGDPSTGYNTNPITGLPYETQMVARGDYTRVLAEFWADGIDSETPPGHWFEIYHYVTDQPMFERKWQGEGPELSVLEYDIKAHLTLGGTMHDAAIAAWSLKGFYDYVRPVSSIRYMAGNGQSSDILLPSYHPNGIPLLENFIELVDSSDYLAGLNYEHVGKIKLYTWKGHDYINDPELDVSGAGWILGENWWPYQRPTFVTPPFAGFVSGHSTFSRAAAGILEYITGSPFFPGGLGEFVAEQNEFLQFENGPSTTITLQWATYQDAADQCSLSRIWGGIHPPIDDIPGRYIGSTIGETCFEKADSIFAIDRPALVSAFISDTVINSFEIGSTVELECNFSIAMDTNIIPSMNFSPNNLNQFFSVESIHWENDVRLKIKFIAQQIVLEQFSSLIRIYGCTSESGSVLDDIILEDFIIVDTKLPKVLTIEIDHPLINDEITNSSISATFVFTEDCDIENQPSISFSGMGYNNESITMNNSNSSWFSPSSFNAILNTSDFNENVESVDINITTIEDIHGNPLTNPFHPDKLSIDTKNPFIEALNTTVSLINLDSPNEAPQFNTTLDFNESMDVSVIPEIFFLNSNDIYTSLAMNPFETFWVDSNSLNAEIWVLPNNNNMIDLDLVCLNAKDHNGNVVEDSIYLSIINSDMKGPEVLSASALSSTISDSLVGNSNYFIDIAFDEPMNTEMKPLVQHENEIEINNSIQYNINQSFFSDPYNYRAFFQINDENIEVDNINLSISYGEDMALNVQDVYQETSFISLDTKNPSIIEFESNTNILNLNDNLLDFQILFDEEMNENQSAQFNFYSTPVIPVLLQQTDFYWLENDSLNVSYELISAGPEPVVYDINVTDATDLAGNLLTPLTLNDLITIQGVLNAEQIDPEEIQLYPNLIVQGTRIHLKNIAEDLFVKNFALMAADGKFIKTVTMEKKGTIWTSEPLDVPSGIYFVHINQQSFRLVVL